MASSTRSRVSGRTPGAPAATRDAVATLTPASRATSLSVGAMWLESRMGDVKIVQRRYGAYTA